MWRERVKTEYVICASGEGREEEGRKAALEMARL